MSEKLIEDALADELQKLGIDITDEASRERFRKNILWADQQRKRCEKIAGYIFLLIAGGIATTLGHWLLTGAKQFLSK